MDTYKQKMTEAALRDFPELNKEYKSYTHYLEILATAGACMCDEYIPSQGAKLYEQDKYIGFLEDPYYKALKTLNETIYSAYISLPNTERRIIALNCWRRCEVPQIASELKFSTSQTYRLKTQALIKLYKPLLPIAELIDDWRHAKLQALKVN